MALIVQKYGGTSVGDAERIKKVAQRVVADVDAGKRIVVVVSAMGHTTDELVDLAGQISDEPHAREMDMLLTSGERISMALLSMAIMELGRGGDLLHRVPGRHRHRHLSRQGAHRRRTREAGARGTRGRQDRDRRRLPGRLDRLQRDDPRSRRVGHDRGRSGGRAGCRCLRDLHRRRRRVHGGSPDRSRRTEAPRGVVRGDAGAVGLRRKGTDVALRRIRS